MKWVKGVTSISALLAVFAPSAEAMERLAQLKIVLQGQRLTFDLDSPAGGFTGLDREPQSVDEQRIANYVKGQLQQATRLFITSPGANCRSFSIKVEEPDWRSDPSRHAYRARYVYQCQRPQLLQAIDVALANQLAPGTVLQAQLTVGNAQQSAELTGGRTTMRIQQ